MKEQAILRINFLGPSEGGRSQPIDADKYGCPVLTGGHALDCRFVLAGKKNFEPGIWHEIGVAFLNPVLAKELLREGDLIQLWEGKVIGKGSVKSLLFSCG